MEGSINSKNTVNYFGGDNHNKGVLLKTNRIGMGLQVCERDNYAGGLGRLFWG